MTVNLSIHDIEQKIAYLSGETGHTIEKSSDKITIFFPTKPINWKGREFHNVNTIIFRPSTIVHVDVDYSYPPRTEERHKNPSFNLWYDDKSLYFEEINSITIFNDIVELCFPVRSVRARVDSGQANNLERRVETLEQHVVDLKNKFQKLETKFNTHFLATSSRFGTTDKEWMAMNRLLDIVIDTDRHIVDR